MWSRPGVPSTRPETLVTIEGAQMWGEENDWTSNPGYKLLDGVLRDLPGVERLSLFTTSATRLYWNRGEKVELDLKFTDEAFWKVYEFPLLEGRFYDRAEVDAAEPVAVISRSARERIFGTGPTTGPLVLQNRSYRVVGVVEDVPVYNKPAAGRHLGAAGQLRGGGLEGELDGFDCRPP
jgi:putative ABC transport system permease protein